MDLNQTLQIALQIMKDVGDYVSSQFHGQFEVGYKEGNSIVTEVDREAEQRIRKALESAFPEHRIMGEEFGESGPDSPYRWIIDPIDGTFHFAQGVPLYGMLLALQYEDESVLGIIHQPSIGWTTYGAKGLGAFFNGSPVKITEESEQKLIGFGDFNGFNSHGHLENILELTGKHPHARMYTDCFGHSLAIQGRIAAMIDSNISLWDYAATEILIREAGGSSIVIEEGNGKHTYLCGRRDQIEKLAKQLNVA